MQYSKPCLSQNHASRRALQSPIFFAFCGYFTLTSRNLSKWKLASVPKNLTLGRMTCYILALFPTVRRSDTKAKSQRIVFIKSNVQSTLPKSGMWEFRFVCSAQNPIFRLLMHWKAHLFRHFRLIQTLSHRCSHTPAKSKVYSSPLYILLFLTPS